MPSSDNVKELMQKSDTVWLEPNQAFTRDSDYAGADQPHEGLRDRIKEVLPLIAANAPVTDANRMVPNEVLKALEATGVFKSWVPKKYGGYEIDLTEFIDIGLMVGEACASTAWLTTFYIEHNWLFSTMFSDELVEEIYSSQPYIIAPGSVNPNGGDAKPVDGGYEITGRWKFATGVAHSDWVIVTASIEGDGMPIPRTFILPREDIKVEDTWHIHGMRGTASHDLVAEGVFVPERNLGPFPPPWRTSDTHKHISMYNLPVMPLLGVTASVPLVGASRRAITVFQDKLAGRIKVGSRTLQQEKAAAQLRLGHAAAEVAKAELVLRAVGKDMEEISVRGRMASMREMNHMSIMIAHAMRDCRTALQSIMDGAGASAHFDGSELQRIYRDLQVASGHTAFDLDARAETYGKSLIKSYQKKKEKAEKTAKAQ